jgi:DNA-binding transcriptional LysR family regulator
MRFGKFRPRFVSIGEANSLEESLVMSANEGAISLQPSLISHLSIPNVVMVPIAEKQATWDLSIVWQRGRMSNPLRALLDSFQLKAKS